MQKVKLQIRYRKFQKTLQSLLEIRKYSECHYRKRTANQKELSTSQNKNCWLKTETLPTERQQKT